MTSSVTHHTAEINGTSLHYVSAGTTGSPILLVHGWPESWWAFRAVIPRLAADHRVFAVDLRGFGDSSTAGGDHDAATMAEDLHHLVAHLGVGPVHVTCQDISGGPVFQFAATHPGDVLSFTAVETALPGYGMELLADVTGGGSWHVGFLAAPGVPELFLAGRERVMLDWAITSMTVARDAVTEADLDEFTRTYARPGGWRGTEGLYRSALTGGDTIRALAGARPLTVPVLAVDGINAPFTEQTMRRIATDVTAVRIPQVGHFVAQEAPVAFAATLGDFTTRVDRSHRDHRTPPGASVGY
ncbi:alpha/beta hydrolase [Actinoplanes philippinensis]|uniref:Pimeloyl-ACP methyl ester carboxylesterase n=1 Tax=Actinoplanes philippinensis TaxID=35752 RepID=A0A1I2DZ19_9ACTN|nr:alpha/beta hydrolase [Actinoplanes philippinensis]GIE77387.1 alpha/beta hydrolase [Actinoplanes philippinensis]SFE85649.1 Pimeloyl-ACP methyl ester carboxylesterase [Actinoplanes philippinensis]